MTGKVCTHPATSENAIERRMRIRTKVELQYSFELAKLEESAVKNDAPFAG
jgi:hypothetical protein